MIDPIHDQAAFPRLNECDLAAIETFGERCSFRPGDILFAAGDHPFDCFVIRAGEIRIMDASTGERTCFIRYGPGYFTGDIDLFTGRPSVVSCEAETAVDALRITPAKLRDMFVRNAELGGRFWKSFQRRRELLLASSFRGLTVYGDKHDKPTLEAIELLYRNGVPHRWADTSLPEDAAALQSIKADCCRLPAITHGSRLVLEAPTRVQLADHLGLRRKLPQKSYDVVILGSGPAGLGAAVYAASEGLSTLVLDGLGPGGQAGASSRIENYAGFPNGVSGRKLAQLSYLQALKFGADFAAPSTVSGLDHHDDGTHGITTAEGDSVTARTVVVATGVAYRLLDVDGTEALLGAGVYYNATKVEAMLCRGEPVHVIGAGNSAGQAAMFLSQFSRNVSLIVRGPDLRKGMSSYLSQRLLANGNVKIHFGTEVISVEGTDHIRAVTLRDSAGVTAREETCGLFVFIGAKPRTDFLPSSIATDQSGFLLTGSDVASLLAWRENRPPCALETSLPGVFACGDCRSGTTKRIAFAIGDGALAVTCVHQYLGRLA